VLKIDEREQPVRFKTSLRPRRECSWVGAKVARREEAGRALRAEQSYERIDDRPRAVQLDGEIILLALHRCEKIGNAPQQRLALRQAGPAGEFNESIDIAFKALCELAGPRQTDERDFR